MYDFNVPYEEYDKAKVGTTTISAVFKPKQKKKKKKKRVK